MYVSQIWYTKDYDQYCEDEDEIMKENNCLDPDGVSGRVSVESSELHNWNKPKIEEIEGGTIGHLVVANGWKHFKSYELDMLVNEFSNKVDYVIYKDEEVLEEGSLGQKDFEFKPLDWWIRSLFLDNYEPFNECDELFKKHHDFDVEDEIFDLLNKYRDDPNSWSGKDALFNAGCLAKRKLCEHAVFYNKDEWEATGCPEDIEDLHFCLVTLHV